MMDLSMAVSRKQLKTGTVFLAIMSNDTSKSQTPASRSYRGSERVRVGGGPPRRRLAQVVDGVLRGEGAPGTSSGWRTQGGVDLQIGLQH